VPLTRIGIPDQLVDHASPEESKTDLGLLPAQMSDRILQKYFSQQETPVIA